jgi:hypothetical protein
MMRATKSSKYSGISRKNSGTHQQIRENSFIGLTTDTRNWRKGLKSSLNFGLQKANI